MLSDDQVLYRLFVSYLTSRIVKGRVKQFVFFFKQKTAYEMS